MKKRIPQVPGPAEIADAENAVSQAIAGQTVVTADEIIQEGQVHPVAVHMALCGLEFAGKLRQRYIDGPYDVSGPEATS